MTHGIVPGQVARPGALFTPPAVPAGAARQG
jgi:hypothetical protein